MQHDEKMKIVKETLKSGASGGVVASAVGVLSGTAMTTVTTTTPITILWGWVTVGTAVATAPVVVPAALVACAVGGAAIAGTAGGIAAYRKIRKINGDFESMINGK